MAEAIHLPKIGMIMEDAVLTRWLIADGAEVASGDAVFEMDIEKVLQDVEVEAAGTLRHLVGDCVRLRPGAVVACVVTGDEAVPQPLIDQVLSQWSEPAEDHREPGSVPSVPAVIAAAAASAPPAATVAPVAAPAAAPVAAAPLAASAAVDGRVAASPFARRLAAELGVDLETVQGTGPRGRVTEADIRSLAQPPSSNGAGGPSLSPEPGGRVVASPIARRLASELGVDLADAQGTGPRGRVTEADVRALAAALATAAPAQTEAAVPASFEAVPYSGRRRAIGERMAQSLRDSAQLTLSSEIRVDDAVRMAGGLSREWRGDRTVVTLTTLVIRAAARALLEHPRFNSRLDGAQIVGNEAINIGFAADAEDGLMVPVIRDAASRPLREVAADFIALSRKNDDNALTAADVTDATFTITSLESTGIDAFTPVINPPQAAILGLGRVRRQPVVGDDGFEVGQITTLSLTIDHRINDGAPAARFLGRVAQLLERPYLLM